jgi:hypothetical protein
MNGRLSSVLMLVEIGETFSIIAASPEKWSFSQKSHGMWKFHSEIVKEDWRCGVRSHTGSTCAFAIGFLSDFWKISRSFHASTSSQVKWELSMHPFMCPILSDSGQNHRSFLPSWSLPSRRER